VGRALLRAKQRYFNSAAAGSFSSYDEKILAIPTIYGLPMLGVTMPQPSDVPPGGASVIAAPSRSAAASGVVTNSVTLDLSYESGSVAGMGSYRQVAGSDDLLVVGNRPVQPRTTRDISAEGQIAHGALLVGGTFSEIPNFDPVISRVVTDELRSAAEPAYAGQSPYPSQLATVNRFLGVDGQSRDRLVVVPGQFLPGWKQFLPGPVSVATVGTQRLYSNLRFEVYHAPTDATDFVAPSVWQVEAAHVFGGVRFQVQADDDSGAISRVVVLYRRADATSWSLLDLRDDAGAGYASGVAPVQGPDIEYIVQAVDATGNVALALDKGYPFQVPLARVLLPMPLVAR
jgi:hypothetical protein